MTHSDLARELGLSRGYISRRASEGMPIDSAAAARRWLAANVEPRARVCGDDAAALVRARVALLHTQRLEVKARVAKTLGKLMPISALAEALGAVTSELAQKLEALPGQLRQRHPELPLELYERLAASLADLRNQAHDELTAAVERIADVAERSTAAEFSDDDEDFDNDEDRLEDDPADDD